VTPDAAARLAALPATLRQWARERVDVRQVLARHVTDGEPLGRVLAVLHALRLVTDEEWVQRRVPMVRAAGVSGGLTTWCLCEWPEGACWAYGTVGVGTPGVSWRRVCADCAARVR
jgi:hypothetical protein